MNSKLLLGLFLALMFAQLYVPVSMVISSEMALAKGKEYKFRIRSDEIANSFYNDFIELPLEEVTVRVPDVDEWERFEPVYVSVVTGDDGFAKISAVSKRRPSGEADHFRALVDFAVKNDENELVLKMPFQTYYPNNSFDETEQEFYQKILSDTTKNIYVLVKVLNGKAVFDDIMVDGRPLTEIVNSALFIP